MKRVFDLIVSIISIVILSPIFLVIAILIKINSRGPVIYKQYRVGKDNKEFLIYKFRSMKMDAPEIASMALNDPEYYITAVGRVIRKTSLDELPQLINIIKGDMSLVGPRPVINDESEEELLKLRRKYGICTLVPGLTGWAQINGRDNMTTTRKVELEREYLEKRSIIFDLKILFKTVLKVFKQDGIVEGKSINNADCEKDESTTNMDINDARNVI